VTELERRIVASEGRAGKRRGLAEAWAKHYPLPIAELIAVVVEPFDDDDTTLEVATLEAKQDARREVRQLFPRDGTPPSGGQIEASLCDIASRLVERLRSDEAASLAAARLSSAIALLGDVSPMQRAAVINELVVPDSVKRLDRAVPFAMWR
jgi:hypothetical protein